jgi:sulfhydrogenase subunit alpha
MKNGLIKVDYLARVEGEGALLVKVRNKMVTDVKFRIFEPPRFFEAFLRGRTYEEVPDIVARICGICPVAYQMSSTHAIESAFGTQVIGPLRELRRLLYCGEWIESHALHVFMLHAPDFLGYADAIQMAKDHGSLVKQALELKKIGNDIVNLIGGREIHPINVRVGGFYRLPTKQELEKLAERLKWAVEFSLGAVKFVGGLPFPDFERDYDFVALRHSREYPMNEGRIVSSKGLDIPVQEYDAHFAEEHVEHSNALQSTCKASGEYFVGPMARYNLNFDKLTRTAQEAAASAGLGPTCYNPFKSIIVRAVEILYACEEALRIIGEYQDPDFAVTSFKPAAGMGFGCTEAPRGLLYHRYKIDGHGLILDAKIVPPTSQNQKTIERDLREFVPPRLKLTQEQLTWQCEQAIRNYDPCISCATHFLKLDIQRETTNKMYSGRMDGAR